MSRRVDRPEWAEVGREIDVDLDSPALGSTPTAVGRLDGLVVFVAGALPGSRVRARVERIKGSFVEARAVETLTPSPAATRPRCRHVGVCGGCAWGGADYAAQLGWKTRLVRDAYARIGGLDSGLVADALPSPEVWGFRNKVELAFGEEAGRLVLGYHRAGTHAVFPVVECPIVHQTIADIIFITYQMLVDLSLKAYSADTGLGLLRALVLRVCPHTGLAAVHLVTADEPKRFPAIKTMLAGLAAACPNLAEAVHSTRSRRDRLPFGERVVQRVGAVESFAYRLSGLDFSLGPNGFFQVNTGAAERLFSLALDVAEIRPQDIVWDAHSGVGAVGLLAAGRCGAVFGCDVDVEAVAFARKNAARNRLDDARFERGSLRDFVRRKDIPRPDVVVADPPRRGFEPADLDALLRIAPERIVAIACDPAAQARDLKRLGADYRLVRAVPVDLFPHSPHIETVALLIRRGQP